MSNSESGARPELSYLSIDNLIQMYDERDQYISDLSFDVETKIKQNYNLELKMLQEYLDQLKLICEKNGFIDYLNQSIKNIDFQILSNLIKNQFYNSTIMETMTCFLQSQLSSQQGFRDLIAKTKIWKDPENNKENLVILFSNLMKAKQKILTLKYEENETLHELIVGLKCINPLREIIPTFVWTYGFTTCNLPIVVDNKLVSTCTQPVAYPKYDEPAKYVGIITEYVEGQSLYEYLDKNISEDKFLSMILTVLYSLKYANESYGFVHWDLHYSNIIMRDLDQKDCYIYLPSENKYLWVGNTLATIIDLGSCSFIDNDKIIFNYFRFDLGIRPDLTTSPMNDVLKFLSSVYSKIEDKPKLMKLFQKIYAHLTGIQNPSYLSKFMKVFEDNYDLYPNYNEENVIENVIPMSIDQLITFVESFSKGIIRQEKPDHVLSCQKSKCLFGENLFETLLTRQQISTVSEFVKAVKQNKNDTYLQKFRKDFIQQTKQLLNKYKYNSSPSAKSVVLFDELYYLVKDIEFVINIGESTSELDDLLEKAKRFMKVYQKSAIEFLKSKKGMSNIRPPDQISILEKDLKSK